MKMVLFTNAMDYKEYALVLLDNTCPIENNYYTSSVDISNDAFLVLSVSILRMCYECKVEDFVSYTQIDGCIKTLIYMHGGHFYEVRRVLP